ncbi:L1P family protein [Acanthamoeba castellanii str. Neff]|uniref:L1P family protein n=1 Tax=Acanthamoeba castellanii (strain ATCC 30010 / Neff) TaxID=1257118 RepID=L8GST1_ACACF|nr:L1P family protein [Acanthamoeba castellanii str. Neff]ELR15638.1 L1P family protein [Acanthamoeba castellanii str. Neff]
MQLECPVQALPHELAIWRMLDRASLCQAALVCHAWHFLSSDNHLWRELCRRELAGVEWTPRMLARRHKSWKRHFAVCISLYYDLDKEPKYRSVAVLPHAIRSPPSGKLAVALILAEDQVNVRAQAAELSVACFDLEYLKAFHRDRKAIKKWARQYSSLRAPRHLLPQVVRALGPQICRMNKLPKVLPDDLPLSAVLEEHSRTATVQLSKVPYIDVAVGNVGMSVAQLVENVNPVLAQVTEVLSIPWDRVKRITLHATKGPSFTVYTASHVPPAPPGLSWTRRPTPPRQLQPNANLTQKG